MVFLRSLFFIAIIATTLTFQVSAVAQGGQGTPAGATEYVYKSVNGADLKLYVFTPTNSDTNRPVVVFFAGGGWTTLPANGGNAGRARALAAQGVVAVTATYRVKSQHNASPYDAVADAKAAIRWVRGRARELGVDPSRVAVFGDSAGAHLALSTAIVPGFDEPGSSTKSRPDAMFLMSAVVTTVAEEGMPLNAAQKDGLALLGERAKEISPLHQLRKGLPPTFIVHGKVDEVMPFAVVEEFCDKAQSFGDKCVLVGVDGGPHNLNQQHRDLVNAEFEKFLRGLRYLP